MKNTDALLKAARSLISSARLNENRDLIKAVDNIGVIPVNNITVETIIEGKSILKALPEKVIEFLLYLLHDKSHVMGNTYKDPNMEKVFELTKNDTFNKPVYRGLYSETLDDFKVGEVTVMNRYQSFSEHENIAKKFSKKGLILKAVKSKGGFNYGGFLVDYYNDLKIRFPQDYMMDDGDFLITSAEEEAEHIFPIGARFKVTAIKDNLIEGSII